MTAPPPRERLSRSSSHVFAALLVVVLVGACGGGNGDSGGQEAGVSLDGSTTTSDASADSGADAYASADGALPDGDASSDAGQQPDPNAHVAPTAAADPAIYNPSIYFKLVNKSSGRLLSVHAGGTSDGDAVIVYDDVGADDQLWLIEESIQGFKKLINKKSGRALSTDHAAGAANGTSARLWQYLATAADQDWSISPGNPGAVRIVSSARTGAALALASAASINDAAAEVSDAPGADQDWVIAPIQTFDPNVRYMIINHNSATALSVFQGGTANDDQADTYSFVNQPDQYWNVVSIGGGYYHFVNTKSGRVLSLTGAATGNGTIAMVYDDLGHPDQAWSLAPLPTGFYAVANQARTTGLLSIVRAQTSSESRAQLWDDIGARDQSWSFVPVGNTATVNALDVDGVVSGWMTGVGLEDVNHEIYGGIFAQLVFGESFQEPARDGGVVGVSGMWSALATGGAAGSYALPTDTPFVGAQYQRIVYGSGTGAVGIDNRGLNRWGIHYAAGQAYDGYVYLRSSASTPVAIAAESESGAIYAQTTVTVSPGTWTRYDFTLTPTTEDPTGKLALTLGAPGTVDVGYVYFEPGAWGRFDGLPVRKDIAEAMAAQGNTFLRFGGSAVLAGGYRWKQMTGPREKRPVFAGWWYPYETNGWGIPEFLSYTESLGVLGIPTFNIEETASDMADFVDYANGDATTAWGAARVADGHPAPYGVHRIELGNEQLIDATFATKFDALAAAIWAKDPSMVLTIGDMSYHDVIADPDHVTGSESGLTTLAPYKTILDFAAARGGALAVDLHTWTDTPEQVGEEIDAIGSFDFWVHQYNPAVNYALNVYELNANSHDMARALGNARAIGLLGQRGRRVKIISSANALQADRQNDNDWSQGLVFYDTQRSWLQPPAYVTQMIAGDRATKVIHATSTDPDVSITAKLDRATLVLEVVNRSTTAKSPSIAMRGFTPTTSQLDVVQLAGNLTDENDATNTTRVSPTMSSSTYALSGGSLTYAFAPSSFTVLRLH